jgi:short-subunit dehydrogenase
MNKHRLLGTAVIAGLVARALIRHRRAYRLGGKSVLITGGSRGLGLLLAHEFAYRGARVAIVARDREELDRAADQLRRYNVEVLTIEADVTQREEAESAVQKVQRDFRRIDVLVNNAGTISVGPLEVTDIGDYRDSLNIHFWAPYFTTMAVLPEMKKRRSGRIINISSIGGKISVPHLLPYSVGKFALTGFSEGLRSELLKDSIYVTAVCPGLMRTGSPRNALFKGKNQAEYVWFSVSDSLPLLSMNARRAARQIVRACERGAAEIVLSLPAKIAVKAHDLFTRTTIDFLGLINRLLPSPGGIGKAARTGQQSFSPISPSPITVLNEQAAERNNQIA